MSDNKTVPAVACYTFSREVLRVGVCSYGCNQLVLILDGVVQEGIKPVDLLSFMTASSDRKNKKN